MSDHYFSIVRSEILPLLPERAARTLEVGCGSGNTLAWLRQVRTTEWLGGVEVSSDAAESARRNIDHVWQGNIETLDLPIEAASLDLVLCLDVLEHLVDPWSVVRRLSGYLRPGGALIASLPNIRNMQVLFPLLLKGRWDYRDEGILDRTHLRFFTERSARELLGQGGLFVDGVIEHGLGQSRGSRFVNALLPRGVRGLFVRQYLLRGRK